MSSWGWSLHLDCIGCDKEWITDKTHIEKFLKELVSKIDMKAYGDPWIEKFGEKGSDKEGITALQMIETSNITCHFCEHTMEAYIDVFSCKFFETKIVVEVIDDFFNPDKIESKLLIRGHK